MRNLKKVLAFVVVFAMMLSTVVYAVPADVEGTDYEDAAVRLGALDIMSGDSAGFRPKDPILRSEFAKVIVNALGIGSSAQYSSGQTQFTDVAANHWASGYINLAADRGIINGYGNGQFGPDDQVTYAQAITMIVRALGYAPKAEAMGGYPSGYLAIAAEEGISDGVKVVATAPATRGDVAMMVDAALDVDLMEQTSWGESPEYEVKEGKTLLTEKLDVDEIVGRVVETPMLSTSNLDDDEVIVAATEINGDKVKDEEDTYTVLTDKMKETMSSWLGLSVKMWVNDDDEIIFAEIDNDDDDYYMDIVDADVASDDEKVSLNIKDDEIDVDVDEVKVYINYQEAKFKDLKKGMYGTFVEEKNKIVFINVFDWERKYGDTSEVSGGSVVAVKASDDAIEYFKDDEDISKLDLDDYDAIYVMDKDGVALDLSDIEKYDVLYWWVDDDDQIFITVVQDTVEGVVNEANDEKVVIDDDEYDVADDATYSDDDDETISAYKEEAGVAFADDEADVIAALDIYGNIRHITGDSEATSGKVYGILTNADSTSVTIFNEAGEEVTYDLASRSEGFTFKKYFDAGKGDDEFYNYNQYIPVQFEINSDGEVKNLKYVVDPFGELQSASTAAEKADKAKKLEASSTETGKIKFDDSDYIKQGSAIYYIDKKETVIMRYDCTKDDDPKLVAWSDIEDTTSDAVKLAVVGDEGDEAEFVVIYANYEDVASTDMYYAVVLEKYRGSGDYTINVDVVENDDIEDGKIVLEEKSDRYLIGYESTLIRFQVNSEDEIKEMATVNKAVYKRYDDKDDYYYVVDANGRTLELAKNPNASSGTKYRIAEDAVIYSTDDGGGIDAEQRYSDVEDGDVVIFVEDKENSNLIKAMLIVTEYAEKEGIVGSGGSGGGSASGDYTVIDVDTTNEILAVRDKDGNPKSFNIPSGDLTYVEKTDGTLTNLKDYPLDSGDEVNLVLTEGTTDVTYIIIKVDK